MQTEQTITATCPHCGKPHTIKITLEVDLGASVVLAQSTPTYPLPRLGPVERKAQKGDEEKDGE